MGKYQKKAKFIYKGSFPDGEVFDDGTKEPLEIVFGRGHVMEALENALMEMEVGEERTLELSAEEAYGPYNEDAIQYVPTYKIPNGQNLPVGERIGWTSPRNVDPIPVLVVEIVNQIAKLDFNHPLAGKDIVYWIKLLDVEE